MSAETEGRAGMRLLATNALPTTRALRAGVYGSELGRLLTPRHHSAARETLDEGIPVAADNDCFQGLDERAFGSMLDALEPVASELMWVSAPDHVGDAEATLESFGVWGPRLRARGFRVALVGQDGLTWRTAPWGDFDALFLGGSTEWKLGSDARVLTHAAGVRGVPVHMGRVNSYKRARYAWQIGCSSVDGSGWARFKTSMGPRWARLSSEMSDERRAA